MTEPDDVPVPVMREIARVPKTVRRGGWTAHPLGGLTPADDRHKGEMNMDCPSGCGNVFIRDTSPLFVEISYVPCTRCDKWFGPPDKPDISTGELP